MRINRRRWFTLAGYGLAFALPLGATLAVTAAPKKDEKRRPVRIVLFFRSIPTIRQRCAR